MVIRSSAMLNATRSCPIIWASCTPLMGVEEPARTWSQDGHAVFAYRCDWDDVVSPPWLNFRALIGAGHGSELPLIFGTTSLGAEYEFQRHLYDDSEGSSFCRTSAAMMSYWGAFARDGAPGRGSDGTLPQWQLWRDNGIMVIADGGNGEMRMSRETCSRTQVIEQIRRDPRVPLGPPRDQLIADFRDHAITQLNAADYALLET